MNRRELKQYECWKEEVQRLRAENQHLHLELMACRPELYQADLKIDRLEKRVAKLEAENAQLKQRVADLTPAEGKPGPFVKLNVPAGKRRRRPGRPAGHEAALRPPPDRIDEEVEVLLPEDESGRCLCPECQERLLDLEEHERVVEELIPATTKITRYHTTSGYCPQCRKKVESRHPDQPPAADLPHAQMGLNALATAAMLRIDNRLPYRQVSRVMRDLAGLTVCPGAIARQVKRMGGWMKGEHERLKLHLRQSPVVHADETSGRIQGRGVWVWTLTGPEHTLFHIDKSRGRPVIRGLLGKAFEGHLVCDFYGVYDKMNLKLQRCHAHLLRELHETAQKSPAFAASPFRRRCRRLCKDMLLLKSRKDTLDPAAYENRVVRLETRLDELARTQSDIPDVTRLAKRLRKHQAELTPFLRVDGLDGTNNAAERGLRPLVVARKISGGFRSKPAAKASMVLTSIIRTAHQQGREALATIKSILRKVWRQDDTPELTPSG